MLRCLTRGCSNRVGLVEFPQRPLRVALLAGALRAKHPLYKKTIRRHKKYMAHDESNECNVGDTVTVVECRPISKTKTWMLKSIDERAQDV